jgi:hypothetical protein
MTARLAIELAAGVDPVDVQAATTRANRIAIGERPAQSAECPVSLVLASLINRLEAQGAGRCGK